MQNVEVVLDVFSGRPNPRWLLTEDQARELSGLVASLEEAGTDDGPPQGLGYRGFTVHGLEAPESEPLRVFHGRAVRPGLVRRDRGRTLERWLLASGKNAVAPALRDHVLQEIAKP